MNGTIYPQPFLNSMQALLGGEYNAFFQSLDTPAPTSVRINTRKFFEGFSEAEPVAWCTSGRYLQQRPSFTFDPSFHAGAYYVQEASSMFIEQVWKQINAENRPVRVLDLCAAPGGKSTHLLSLMSAESLLVSNELVQPRNKILLQNILKWGNANCIVTQNKPEDFTLLPAYFDIILIDAPCSGEGLFRKDKNAVHEWSEANVNMCVLRQQGILDNAVKALKPGGYLIYSTCTFEPAENDNNIERLLLAGFSLVGLDVQKYEGIQSTRLGWQFFPHRVRGEGFFISVLQKDAAAGGNMFGSAGMVTTKGKKSALPDNYLKEPSLFTEITRNNIVFAMPLSIAHDFEYVEKKLYIRQAGIAMGEYKGKDFLPAPGLALSIHLRNDLTAIDLDRDDAITYLRGEAPTIKTDDRGWHLAQYKQLNLGWLKALGNRGNNYYPREWRILKREDN